MQFKFPALTSAIFAALCIANVVNALVSPKTPQLDCTTDANLTFIGEPLNKRAALNTMVIYCNRRTQNVCGGTCTVYNGNAKCLDAPSTRR
ncbi:hypothetical protein MPER_05454, partial [Moniliophthora perniciosa FA553]